LTSELPPRVLLELAQVLGLAQVQVLELAQVLELVPHSQQ